MISGRKIHGLPIIYFYLTTIQTDFSGYPLLAKHLGVLVFKPTSVLNSPLGYAWICFRPHGGAYSSRTAIDALAALVC
jgi:hypothetical protein